MNNAKAFISYSWSSPTHEAWVLNLATELRENGVDVILDKWDLREGHDKYKFMEQMVTDPSLDRVVVVCDRAYARKANARVGGVGTESQIISKEVYERVDQTKFVALVAEMDEAGHPCVPTFLATRIHIDMSTDDLRRDNFEQLLRWIFAKPIHEKPALGRTPAFLTDQASVSLGTSSRQRRAIDAIKQERTSAPGALADYLETLNINLDRLPMMPADREVPGDTLLRAAKDFLPYRDEFIDVAMAAARYSDAEDTYANFADFFESLLQRCFQTTHERINSFVAETMRLLIYELFLYFSAALLKNRRYRRLRLSLSYEYHIPDPMSLQGRLRTFETFQQYPELLIERKKALKLQRFSLLTDLIRERATRSDLTIQALLETDFVLFVYSAVHFQDRFQKWYPYVALLAGDTGALPFFDRARSRTVYQATVAEVFGLQKEDLMRVVRKTIDDSRWQDFWERIDVSALMNEPLLASRD